MDKSRKILYARNKNIVMREIAGETLLIPITQSKDPVQKIFSLNESATAILEALSEPLTFEELIDILKQQYDVPDDIVRKEVKELLAELEERSFVIREAQNG